MNERENLPEKTDVTPDGSRGTGQCECPCRKAAQSLVDEAGPITCQVRRTHKNLVAALSAPCHSRERIIAEYIDQNSVTCDCCQHIMIDVTAVRSGERGHCIAGDPEGEGSGCAWSFHGEVVPKLETERDSLRSELDQLREFKLASIAGAENMGKALSDAVDSEERLAAERDSLRALLDEVREALRPFVEWNQQRSVSHSLHLIAAGLTSSAIQSACDVFAKIDAARKEQK